MSDIFDTIVIGGGQAGLAAGYELQRSGLRFTILEAGAQAAGSWPHYYDSLKLFSTAGLSGLPGLPFPGKPDWYPDRNAVVSYLPTYADQFALPVLVRNRVTAVTRDDAIFGIRTGDGQEFYARTLIAATGSFGRPYLPALPGQAAFRGRLLHAADYRNPTPYNGQRVVVVGGGNSGVQIAGELAHNTQVTLTTRSAMRLTPQRILGRDLFFWTGLIGVDRVPLGHVRRLFEPQLVIDAGGYRDILKNRTLDWRPMFVAFTADGVLWSDGRAEAIDAVILATGYRSHLAYLNDLRALDVCGEPVQRGGVSRTTPGLYYVGLSGQRSFASASLRGVGPDAAYVVSHLRRYLRQRRQARPS